MSTIGGNNATLIDIARLRAPDGGIMKVAELLTQTNRILEDAQFKECNNGMSNIGTVRSGQPEGTWRKLYGGVQSEKGTTEQITDTCGMLETYSEPDKAMADMAPDKAAFMMTEAKAFIAGLSKTMAKTLFYGDIAITPERFEGLASRYNAYGDELNDEVSAYNTIDAGGRGTTNTSLYIVSWGQDRISGLYPKGSKAGLSQRDLGEVTVTKADGSKYQAYRTHYKWDMGLAVFDWRYGVRICNIDATKLAAAGTTAYAGPDLTLKLIDAIARLPEDAAANTAIYANRLVWTALNKLAQDKHNVNLSIDEFGGKKILNFWGYPIKRSDAIINREAAVPQYAA